MAESLGTVPEGKFTFGIEGTGDGAIVDFRRILMPHVKSSANADSLPHQKPPDQVWS